MELLVHSGLSVNINKVREANSAGAVMINELLFGVAKGKEELRGCDGEVMARQL